MDKNLLTFKLNTYFATLIITVVGAGASLFIIHTADRAHAYADSLNAAYSQY